MLSCQGLIRKATTVCWPGVTNNATEFPPAQVDEQTSTGLADLCIQPFTLCWSVDQADFMAGLGIYAPTGNTKPAAK